MIYLSQSLADLFTAESGQKKVPTHSATENHLIQQDIPLAYPSAESMSDVIPPDEGKPAISNSLD